MVDKVKPLKIENPATGGTQTDPFPVEANPASDFITGKGFSFENNDNRIFDMSPSGDIRFKDFTESTLIELWKLRRALYEIFDNTSNGFTATNSQAAIEEAKSSAVGKVRFVITTLFNSAIANNNWLGYSELLPGDTVGIRLPIACKLKEISVSYNGISVDGRIDLYKNGTGAGQIIDNTTFTFTNQDNGKSFTGINLSFAANDILRGRWIDTGTNPSDMAILYFFEVL